MLPVELAPFGLAVYKVNSGSLRIASYTTEPISAGAASHLENLVKLAAEGGSVSIMSSSVSSLRHMRPSRQKNTREPGRSSKTRASGR